MEFDEHLTMSYKLTARKVYYVVEWPCLHSVLVRTKKFHALYEYQVRFDIDKIAFDSGF